METQAQRIEAVFKELIDPSLNGYDVEKAIMRLAAAVKMAIALADDAMVAFEIWKVYEQKARELSCNSEKTTE